MKKKLVQPAVIFFASMVWLIVITACTSLMALGFEKGVLG
jgi:hypothetical protein